MRRAILLLTLVAAMLLACAGVVMAQQGEPAKKDVIPDNYIVVLKDKEKPKEVSEEHATKYNAKVNHVYEHALNGYSAEIPADKLDKVKADKRVQFVSEDRAVEAVAQTLPTGINRIEGDLSSTKSGDSSGNTNTAVAVLDTGIDKTHPELNVVGGTNCINPDGGYKDGNGHGTHVSGTIAARDNTAGVVGVAPGAPLYAVKVLNAAGSGTWSSVICGIDWVTNNATSKNIKVANMSLGGSGSDDGNCGNSNNDALHKAICGSASKVTYAVAAGNSGTDLAGFVPAAYNEVLAVTAVADFNGQPGGGAAATCRSDVDETAADFSNFATSSSDQGHTIAAPGVCIYSTWKDGGYNTISGTSMASPHVAGTAALYVANNPSATPAQVVAKLLTDAASKSGTDPTVSGYYGFTDDPNKPNGSRYFGYLLYTGGY